MMRQANFLKWIYYRMVDVHGENVRVDYMLKLKTMTSIDKGLKALAKKALKAALGFLQEFLIIFYKTGMVIISVAIILKIVGA